MENNKMLETINSNIREILSLREINEADFCKQIGVSKGYFDRKRDDIGILKLILIAQTLKIRPENIWDEEFIIRERKEALKGKIERLQEELDTLNNFMEKPVKDIPSKK